MGADLHPGRTIPVKHPNMTSPIAASDERADRYPRTISRQRQRTARMIVLSVAINIGTYLYPHSTVPIKHPNMTSLTARHITEGFGCPDRYPRTISRNRHRPARTAITDVAINIDTHLMPVRQTRRANCSNRPRDPRVCLCRAARDQHERDGYA